MIKHTQKIRRQKLTNYLSVFDHFVGLALKGLTQEDVNGFFHFQCYLLPVSMVHEKRHIHGISITLIFKKMLN